MANLKISELDALTTAASADVIPIVDDTSNPSLIQTKKITVDDLILTSTQTLTNKTLTDCDASTQSAGNNTTKIATTAFVTTAVAASDTLAEVLANGNTTGGTDLEVTSGDVLKTNTISETTSASGVTIDSVLVKDNAVTATTFTGALTGDVTGNADTATALKTARTIGGTSFDGTGNIVPATITVADTTDTTCSVGLFESATGDLAPKSDGGITYNAGTGMLTATGLTGPLTGNVTGNCSGTAATVTGAAQTAITSVGTLTGLSMSGDLDLADDAKIQLGDGDDLQLYHDGSNTYIKDDGTGDFFIQSNGVAVKIQGLIGEDSIVATANGSVKLYYDNAGKLETASGGVNVTGDLAVSGTVTSGVWSGTAIGVAKGGTNLTSYAAGDVLYATGSTTLAKLAKPGTPAGEVLTFATSASAPSWVAPTTGDITGVTAGAGLTGGGASGDVTVTVGAGTGITVNADDVALTNTDITIGSTAISLGATATTIAGLSSVTSTTFVGALTGSCSGSAATVTGAAQTAITSVGTLTDLTVSGTSTTVGTVTSGIWNGTAVDGAYVDIEGTEVKSTGETGGTKFLREDGDNSCSWQTVSATVSIGTSIGSGTSGSVLFVDSSTQLAQDNSNLFWDDSNNRLGIGTTVPTETLDVSGGNAKITNAANVYLSLDSTQTNGDEWQIFNANSGATSTLQFKNVDQSKVVMLLDENGFVGINVTDPDSELEINGQIKITGGVPGADKILTSDAVGLATWETLAVEGTEVKSTGETGGTKFLREDGDGTCSWQSAGGGGVTALTEVADVEIDFDGDSLQTLEVTGTCSQLSTTNLSAGKTVTLRIYNNAGDFGYFTPTTPAWKEMNESITSSGVLDTGYGILKLISWGTANADVTAELQLAPGS